MLDTLINHPQETRAFGRAVYHGRLHKHAGQREVCQQHAKCNRNQEQRFKFLTNAEIQQQAGNQNHNKVARVVSKRCESRFRKNLLQRADEGEITHVASPFKPACTGLHRSPPPRPCSCILR